MKLQPIEYCHLKECADLFIAVFSNPPWNETWSQKSALSRLKDCYDTPGSYGIIAIAENQVFGFAIGFAETWYKDKHFFLKEMCVQSAKQRSGIGTKIMDMLYQDLVTQGVRTMYLLTVRDSSAEAFYEKCGFSNHSKMQIMSKTLKVQLQKVNESD
ncbi:GNAT family N-acetyltransferase [Gloeocapsopsis crepidinum LEGE 06123]|uniref:GNAT family N-acetyltransferase n=1 Tax=Gloeocapsopsis crepidinum LEGE 06123 TaxID=588587 RepID=A0ABR9UYY3_9CHRO|nr:GNAT family N-acetyltransferase [Gloeocapsopsis crepidinum]MBE9193496.1 GNAT family N-acetyltransferase [Gloeocapsopsis crepidinum LEGE 06123]